MTNDQTSRTLPEGGHTVKQENSSSQPKPKKPKLAGKESPKSCRHLANGQSSSDKNQQQSEAENDQNVAENEVTAQSVEDTDAKRAEFKGTASDRLDDIDKEPISDDEMEVETDTAAYEKYKSICGTVGQYLQQEPEEFFDQYRIPEKFYRRFWVMDIVKSTNHNCCCFTKRCFSFDS